MKFFYLLTLLLPLSYINSLNLNEIVTNKISQGEIVKIVCYGDSITWGYETAFLQSNSNYPLLLEQKLRDLYKTELINVFNKGKNSMTSLWGVENIKKLVLDENPDIVIISFGINDVIYLNGLDSYLKCMSKMNDLLIEKNISSIFMTPTPILGPYRNGVKAYAAKVKELFVKNSNNYVDLFEVFSSILSEEKMPIIILPDLIHPIKHYYIISDSILKLFENDKN